MMLLLESRKNVAVNYVENKLIKIQIHLFFFYNVLGNFY